MRFSALANPDSQPRVVYPPYRSTRLRGPVQAPVELDWSAANWPQTAQRRVVAPLDADLTGHGAGAPIGERIVVVGQVTDEDGRPVADSLVEVWQCNAAGRYWHSRDQHDAPLDPNFFGAGKFFTDAEGRYRFQTIKPGAYPWGNHHKAWRPAHIHFSLFGNVLAQRLVTQMYFPGDPLMEHDPIVQSIEDPAARQRLVSRFSMDESVHEQMLGYEFDIVLRGRAALPFGL